jgi:hypothetical protein
VPTECGSLSPSCINDTMARNDGWLSYIYSHSHNLVHSHFGGDYSLGDA